MTPPGSGGGTPIGALDGSRPVFVDGRGSIRDRVAAVAIGWAISSEERFHDPVVDPAVRQPPPDGAVVETSMRVAGGDAVHRVFGAGAGVTVVEIENASPAAFAVSIVVSDLAAVSVQAARPPSRSCSSAGADLDAVRARLACDDTQPGAPSSRGAGALVWPVAHRTTLRLAVTTRARRDTASESARAVEVETLPTLDQVRRSWQAQLDRGFRVEIDDRVVQAVVDASRIAVLVRACEPEPEPMLVAALEDWGFDTEAALAWSALGFRGRRRAARRPDDPLAAWTTAKALLDAGVAEAGAHAHFLVALRAALVAERADGVDLFAGFPADWLGLGIAMHRAPLRRDEVSAALRWHGERPAVLWDNPGGLTLHASRLAPDWSTSELAGDALLPAAPGELLAFGSPATRSVDSETIEPPHSFS